MDVSGNNNDIGGNLETLMFFGTVILTGTKTICISWHQKKLAVNINAAINDWSSVKNDEKNRKIMKKYAFRTKILSLVSICLIIICFAVYLFYVIVNLYLTYSETSFGKIKLYIYYFILISVAYLLSVFFNFRCLHVEMASVANIVNYNR